MEIKKYVTTNGSCPFENWMQKLKDKRAKAQILIRLDRVRIGNFGDHKSVGNDVYELRITKGKGYRVYYAHVGNSIIILFCGGSKATQSKDIKLAKQYWSDYNANNGI
ncbi:MAG: type II toxin-antitoxin system RelE/ParE family toxin [Thiomargarita sp.]|nr:type II toxin-antitoxin system RelE/ParE family toxin [Thiomargarita sp.]